MKRAKVLHSRTDWGSGTYLCGITPSAHRPFNAIHPTEFMMEPDNTNWTCCQECSRRIIAHLKSQEPSA